MCLKDLVISDDNLLIFFANLLNPFLVDLVDKVSLDAELVIMFWQALTELVAEVVKDHE